ncbi:hypothetical protein ACJRO7_032619, partial [Eucalyptus globulus]
MGLEPKTRQLRPAFFGLVMFTNPLVSDHQANLVITCEQGRRTLPDVQATVGSDAGALGEH